MIVAIDGPAGAGKSSVARAVASELGFRYLDTGAMYRAVALAALERSIDPHEPDRIAELAQNLEIDVRDGGVSVDGVDVTDRIRERDVTEIVPQVSAVSGVRNAMARHQRVAAMGGDVVIEGRDIGTVIAPNADVKIFLTASLGERARRRCAQLGLECDAQTLKRLSRSIAARDAADSTRVTSPLEAARDAVVVDTSELSLEEVVERIIAMIRPGGPAVGA
ncbi:MAG: (d)CMP kinase [Actinomycetota bacterium]|nr:(d)CMP kinase [Actinomycetota bacterium]